jgi:hypothetical protein
MPQIDPSKLRAFKICPRCNGIGRFSRGTCFRCNGLPLERVAKHKPSAHCILGGMLKGSEYFHEGLIVINTNDRDTALKAANVFYSQVKSPKYHSLFIYGI